MIKSMLFTRSLEAAESLLAKGLEAPRVGVVLGSGLGGLVDRLESPRPIPYAEIPHFPAPTVSGHAGNLVAGRLSGVPVVMFQGRLHYYEGHDLGAVTFPIRLLQQLGAEAVILTAATGGLAEGCGPGRIVCLSDHLNLIGANPLRGQNDDRLGPRFPDMSAVYSPRLRAVAGEEARAIDLPLADGVYAALTGPCYETPAEIRMLRALGADVVGMSTVPEAIAARHGGLEVLAFAVVTNWAAGVSGDPLSHEEVLRTSLAVGPALADLIARVVGRIGEAPAGHGRA